MVNTLPIDIPPPVCPIMLGCTSNDPSNHYFSMLLLLELSVTYKFRVPLIYSIRQTNLAFSGSLTLVVRNETVMRVSGLAHLVVNNVFVTK